MVKLAPMAFGAEFLVRPEREAVDVDVTLRVGMLPYRVSPNFSQQREHQRQDTATGPIIGPSTVVAAEVAQHQVNEETGSPSLDDETIVIEQERENQTAEVDSPEVADSARDQTCANSTGFAFLRFRNIDCHVTGRIVISIDQGGSWAVDSSNLQASLDQEVARAQQIALTDPKGCGLTGIHMRKYVSPSQHWHRK